MYTNIESLCHTLKNNVICQLYKKMHQVNMAIPSEFLVIIPFTNSIPPIWQATNNNLSCVYTETLEINYELLYFNFYNSTENSRCCNVIYLWRGDPII